MQRARRLVVTVAVAVLALSVGLGVASATPAPTPTTNATDVTTQADTDANVTIFVAPGSAYETVRESDTAIAYDGVQLTPRPFVTLSDTIVVQVSAPGLGEAVGGQTGNSTTERFLTLLDSNQASLYGREAFTDEETTPRVFSVDDPEFTSVSRVETDTYRVALDPSAVETVRDENGNGLPDDGNPEPLGTGSVYEFDFTFDERQANNTILIFQVGVEFETGPSGNLSDLLPKPNQRISGRTTLAPGTELTVEITGLGAEPFRRTTTVYPSGTAPTNFTATFDLTGLADDMPVQVLVRNNGSSIGSARTRIPALVASLSVPDRIDSQTQLQVQRVNFSQSGFLVVRAGGPDGPIVSNRYLGGGVYRNLTVQFNRPVRADSLYVATYVDIDQDRVFDRDGLDRPFEIDGDPVAAVVDVAGTSGTPAATTRPPETDDPGTPADPDTRVDRDTPGEETTRLVTPPSTDDPLEPARPDRETSTRFTPYTVTASGPGFGAGLALAALVALLGLLAWRGRS